MPYMVTSGSAKVKINSVEYCITATDNVQIFLKCKVHKEVVWKVEKFIPSVRVPIKSLTIAEKIIAVLQSCDRYFQAFVSSV